MSTFSTAKRRGTMLNEIMRYHREQLPKTMREVPLANLRAFARVAPPTTNFLAALQTPGIAVIAECKKASPSKGLLVPQYNAVELAKAYVKAGAKAISVLTDGRHFQGSLADLRDVKSALKNTPVLRKDFIFDPYQVYEARVAGADAILLIASVLGDAEIKSLLALSHELGMNVLVEVHTEEELGRVLPLGVKIVGINNRNLQTFEVDFENTARLRQLIPPGIVVVAESGLKTADDIHTLKPLGIDAVLVGETFVTSKDINQIVRDFVGAGRPSKLTEA